MLKTIKPNQNFKNAIIISAAIHIAIFTVVNWKSLGTQSLNILKFTEDRLVIDAVIIDPKIAVKNFKITSTKYQQKEVKYPTEQQKPKENEKKKIKETLKKNQEKCNKIKETCEFKNEINKKYKKKGSYKVRKEENKGNIESIYKKDINSEKSVAAISNADTKKNSSVLSTGSSNTQNNIALSTDITNYANQIKLAIENQFYNVSSYSGKTCSLRVKLAQDGTIIDIYPERGDPFLCKAALSAARHAKIPAPPSYSVYEFFKNSSLDFKP